MEVSKVIEAIAQIEVAQSSLAAMSFHDHMNELRRTVGLLCLKQSLEWLKAIR